MTLSSSLGRSLSASKFSSNWVGFVAPRITELCRHELVRALQIWGEARERKTHETFGFFAHQASARAATFDPPRRFESASSLRIFSCSFLPSGDSSCLMRSS